MPDLTFSFDGLEQLEEQLKELSQPENMKQLREDIVKSFAQTYLATAKQNTPVLGAQKYEVNGQTKFTKTEHMRRSWTVGNVTHKGIDTIIPVVNSASYASFVNDGHLQQPGRYVPALKRKLKKGWVEGLHITEKAEIATKRTAPTRINQCMNAYFSKHNK